MNAAAAKQAAVASSPLTASLRGNGGNAASVGIALSSAPVGDGWPASGRPPRIVLKGGPFDGCEHLPPEDRWVSLYMPDLVDPTVTHCYRPHTFEPTTWTYSGAARVIERPGDGWIPEAQAA